jgi:hypothetical protein
MFLLNLFKKEMFGIPWWIYLMFALSLIINAVLGGVSPIL